MIRGFYSSSLGLVVLVSDVDDSLVRVCCFRRVYRAWPFFPRRTR